MGVGVRGKVWVWVSGVRWVCTGSLGLGGQHPPLTPTHPEAGALHTQYPHPAAPIPLWLCTAVSNPYASNPLACAADHPRCFLCTLGVPLVLFLITLMMCINGLYYMQQVVVNTGRLADEFSS